MSSNENAKLGAVVMAAGLGTRKRPDVPKNLHPLLGRRMIDWVLETAREVDADRVIVVVAPATADAFSGFDIAVQEQPLGTGDAVRRARAALEGEVDDVLVLSGDAPLLTPELLRDLLATHRREEAWATVLSFDRENPSHYGRVLRNGDG